MCIRDSFKRAEEVLIEESGKPPYWDRRSQLLHADILRQLAEVRQNLDNYSGALDTLNKYESFGYTDSFLASSKSWILFKLKHYDEAIEVPKSGLEKGQNTLNILGILFSVTGEREKAIKTLTAAYKYEKSLDGAGQGATPLNNLGEVFRETFIEDSAVNSWTRAIKLPDGCTHILPSLNLAIIYIESLPVSYTHLTLPTKA